MTNEKLKNNPIAKFFTAIKWLYRPLVLSLLTGGIAWGAITVNRMVLIMETRTFTSIEKRVLTEQFLSELKEGAFKDWVDHMAEIHPLDTLIDAPTREEFNEILKNQALNIYEIKQQFRTSNNSDTKLERTLNIIMAKIEQLDDRLEKRGY